MDDSDEFWLKLDEQTKANIEEGIRDFDQNRHVDFFEHMKKTYGIEPTAEYESQN